MTLRRQPNLETHAVRPPRRAELGSAHTATLALLLPLLALGCGDDDGKPAPALGDAQVPEDSGGPAIDPASELARLSFEVDESLEPSADDVGVLDGEARRMEMLEGPDGTRVELVAGELLVATADPALLSQLMQRQGGSVLWTIDSGVPGGPAFTLLRVEPRPTDPDGLAQLVQDSVEDGMGMVGGTHKASSSDVLDLIAAAMEESALLGAAVSPNIVMSLASVGTGSTVEADQLGATNVERDACTWSYMDRGSAQDIGVCAAWRLLVQQGKDEERVDVVLVDQGFMASPDTPAGSEFFVPGMTYAGEPFWNGPMGSGACPEAGACKWHGTWTSSALAAVPDNAWGSAGPGGLVSQLLHLDVAAALPPETLSRLSLGAATLDQLQAAVLWLTSRGLPPRVVSYLGMTARIPLPIASRVVASTAPLFELARNAGVLVFAPAGNAGRDVDRRVPLDPSRSIELSVDFPCEMPGVVCVGGLSKDSDQRHPNSNFGSAAAGGTTVTAGLGTVDVFAPFDVLVGPDPDDELDEASSLLHWRQGTSLSAPFAAGVAALIWAADPEQSADEVEQRLLSNMHQGSSSPEVSGWVDAYAAVRATLCDEERTFYRDADGDGFGDPGDIESGCLAPEGYVEDDGDCDDGDGRVNPDAAELCDGEDQNCDPDDENDAECDDGLFCTSDDSCDDGECTGSGASCDAGEVCNEDEDQCDECDGDGDCDDDVFCNGVEQCNGGSCEDGSAPALDDGVDCTDDVCNEDEDRVDHVTDDDACDDGLFCNGAELCDSALDCQPGTPPTSDGVSCTTDTCFEGNDSVTHTPNDAACPDNSLFCDGEPVCSPTLGCQAGTAPCPSLLCSEASDVCNPCSESADCDDGQFCTGTETCNTDSGACIPGVAPTQSDGVACTQDTCNEVTNGFDHVPSDAACGDALYCNGVDHCDGTLGCLVSAVPLSDGVTCTTDACVEAGDSITHTPNHGACSNGLFCDGAELCDAIDGCEDNDDPTPPDDGIPCTIAVCNESSDGFNQMPNNGFCGDGQYCNGSETCNPASGCQSGGDPCPGDACNELADECVECTVDGDCADADPCTADHCVAFVCEHVNGGSDWYDDDDADGYGTTWVAKTCTNPGGAATLRGDCDDDAMGVHPGASETCNDVDDDCDGSVDDGMAFSHYFYDGDGDDFGSSYYGRACSSPGSGYATNYGDCDDEAMAKHPFATETCNGSDDDCDDVVDEDLSYASYFYDGDGDGAGTGSPTRACASPGSAYVTTAGDCDDEAGGSYPGAVETCDDADNDCDDVVDEDLAYASYFYDGDGDDHGRGSPTRACASPGPNYVTDADDCNDESSGAHPGASESCNDADDDCDGVVDEDLTYVVYFFDSDGDDYGAGSPTRACGSPGVDYATATGDCNDGSNGMHPGASEVCDDVDNDCDGLVDEGLTFVDYYADGDDDGCGGAFVGSECVQPPDTVTNGDDCQDGNAGTCGCGCDEPPYPDSDGDGTDDCSDCQPNDMAIHPGATELCDGVDQNCDHRPDNGLTFVNYWYDGDGDGVGGSTASRACSDPGTQWVTSGGDCNDSSESAYPGADEACDEADNDCDGSVDEDVTFTDYWYDNDGDGIGSGTASSDCSDPGMAWVTSGGDCNDIATGSYPGADEACDDSDNDCDGSIDEDVTFADYWYDSDGDGVGSGSASRYCSAPGGQWVTAHGDCNEGSTTSYPGAQEACDDGDDDCDGRIDEGLSFTDYWFDPDGDGTGYGTASSHCSDPGGQWVTTHGDCDEESTSVHPGATEDCDSVDDDCDGVVDDGLPLVPYWTDGDSDGYGAGASVPRCSNPGSGWSSTFGDCNDGVAAANPGELEVCDAYDNDCDTQVNEDLTCN